MQKIKNKKNFSLTKEAHEFAKDISSHAGNPSGVGQLAQLGFSIGIADDKHKTLESASKNMEICKIIRQLLRFFPEISKTE